MPKFLHISVFPVFPALLTAAVLLLALASRPLGAQERVVLQLRWEHQFQFAGFYAAQWEGYFREAGLEVEIRSAVKPDGKVMNAPKEVAEGRAHFGVAGPDILLARDRGMPLVVLAVLAQQSPVIVVARSALEVKTPSDLAGLRVRRVPSDSADAEFQAMLRASGVDLSQIRHSTRPYYRASFFRELAEGDLDAIVVYSLTSLWLLQRLGLEVSTLRPASYGVDFYGDSIFTVEGLVRERPELVERFLQASLRGWRYALDHPEEIADRIAAEFPRFNPPTGDDRREFNRFQIQEVTRLSHYPIIQMGHINPERWRRMHQALMRSGLIRNELDLNALIYDPNRDALRTQKLILFVLVAGLCVALLAFGAVYGLNRVLAAKVRARTKALSESESKYRTLIEQASDGIFITDENGNFLEVNLRGCELLGCSQEELIHLNVRDFVPPEEMAKFKKRNIQLIGGGSLIFERPIPCKDGSRFPAEISAKVLADGRTLAIVRDITERKRAEEAKKESEGLLNTFFEVAPLLLAIKDQDGRYVSVNQNWCRFYGTTPQAVLGRLPTELPILSKELAFEISQEDQRTAVYGTVDLPEMAEVDCSGETHFFHVIKVAIKGRQGEFRGLVSMALDVSEQKQAEEELQASQRLLQTVFDTIPHWVMVKDSENRYLKVNKPFAHSYGKEPADFVNRTPEELGIGTRKEWEQVLEVDRLVVRTGQSSVLPEFKLTLPDGKKIIRYAIRLPLLDDAGNVVGIVVESEDITERKQAEEALRESEEKFRAMADNSPSMSLKDLEGHFILVNRQFEVMHGISSKQAIGKKTEDFFPAALSKMVVEQEKEVLRTGHTIVWELDMPLPNGSKVTCINTKFPIWDHNSKITGVGTITTDISDRKTLEEQLRQSQKMEALGTLAGGIAHDFNNILYPIMGFSDLLLGKFEAGSEEYLYLTYIAESAHRAKDLVSQILIFSRRSQTPKSVCDLVPVAQEVVKLMRSTLPITIAIEEKVSEAAAAVFCDSSQMHQVLVNLCVNAGQAISGIGKIKIGLETVEFEGFECFDGAKLFGRHVRLAVTDSGIGMDKETLSQIFDPFFTTKAVGEGTGLGLSTVFGIVQNHGGGIAVSSEPGKGTTFEVFLPLAEGKIEKLPDTPDPVRNEGGENILFVDDEEAITKLGRIALERMGYNVTPVSDGKQALEIFAANPERFDLVVTDQTMPNMTGETLVHELLKLKPGIPIILCTGHSERISPESSKAIGISSYLYKPIRPKELGRVVREVLDQATEVPSPI